MKWNKMLKKVLDFNYFRMLLSFEYSWVMNNSVEKFKLLSKIFLIIFFCFTKHLTLPGYHIILIIKLNIILSFKLM